MIVAESVHAAIPHDLAVRCPHRMTVVGAVSGEPHEVRAIWPDGVDVEIDVEPPEPEMTSTLGYRLERIVWLTFAESSQHKDLALPSNSCLIQPLRQ